MLVMYTLNQTVSSKLPQTSMIKFIDVWIIYGLFLHFVILVLLILIEHLYPHLKVVKKVTKIRNPKICKKIFT